MKRIIILFSMFMSIFASSALSMTNEESDKIFKFATNYEPFFTVNLTKDNIEYIIGAANTDYEDRENYAGCLFKLAKIGGKWVVLSKLFVDNDDGAYGILYYGENENVIYDLLSINNQQYIYFEGAIGRDGSMYNNAFMYRQFLYDIKNDKLNILGLDKWGDNDIEYINIEDFKNNVDLLKVFNDKAKSSKIISTYINSDTNIDSPANFIKKFKSINKKLYESLYSLDENIEFTNKIIFTKYKKWELSGIFDQPADLTAENSNYKLSAYGVYLIALDKENNEDIVIFLENQSHNCLNCKADILEIIDNNAYVCWGDGGVYSSYYIIDIKNSTLESLLMDEFKYDITNKMSKKIASIKLSEIINDKNKLQNSIIKTRGFVISKTNMDGVYYTLIRDTEKLRNDKTNSENIIAIKSPKDIANVGQLLEVTGFLGTEFDTINVLDYAYSTIE